VPPVVEVPVPGELVAVPALVAVPVEALVVVPVPVLVALSVPVELLLLLLVVVVVAGGGVLLGDEVGTVKVGAPAVLPLPVPPPPQAATDTMIATAATTAVAGLSFPVRGVSRRPDGNT
jgi:hypothetical protein